MTLPIETYRYDNNFYNYLNAGAIRSAEIIISLLLEKLDVTSVADFGCGQGAWLSVWEKRGVTNFVGIDGDYVDRSALLISKELFVPGNLQQTIDLGRKFSLVQSLEVAEHLPESAADTFVATLVSHSDIVMFSSARPGQGGENHINEQPYDHWRAKFVQHDYIPLDLIRPVVETDPAVEAWYRFNTLVYVNRRIFETLPSQVQSTAIVDGQEIPEFAPLFYRLRCKCIAALPTRLSTLLAIIKKHWICARCAIMPAR